MQRTDTKSFSVGDNLTKIIQIYQLCMSQVMSSVVTMSQRKVMLSHTTNKPSVFVSGNISNPKKSKVLTLKIPGKSQFVKKYYRFAGANWNENFKYWLQFVKKFYRFAGANWNDKFKYWLQFASSRKLNLTKFIPFRSKNQGQLRNLWLSLNIRKVSGSKSLHHSICRPVLKPMDTLSTLIHKAK